ncbi:LuxR C-terminal-related transcriptional regulator [Lentzea sp. BCCO 10_0798]|uniref:LuxR C-terminal-related transcriptional regulator n=1 Tax=Lentzea kristufekii TaxID=3095430 RepID=A0ABU4TZZ0_9PSEU|nr:LuxR C-terminal-related transcriptional regulator [Lentzea sp. BCCO 10_0798]MDX8053653.1 LuxR C-terminal-related transcriptional regulator [Lentzea sp. BCCO 10_0798]
MGVCPSCGTEFASLPSRARYCSNACRQRAYRRRSTGTSTVVAELPGHDDAFVGRERELTELLSLLRKHRMLTLVGSAGVGKTRLAVELARRARRAEVRTVELGRLSRPEQVVEAFAEAVGVYQRAGVALRTTLLQELGNRRILLLVDNCEHLVEECCAVVDALLSRCPNVQVLATSREALRSIGEVVYPLHGMADAAELFVERAAVSGDPDVIAEICAGLDGVPLAVELAAKLSASVPLRELADRLDHRLDLLGGLRAAIAWSHDLLTAGEQALFRRLALLPGGFGLDIAQVVHGGEVIGLLTALQAKSLVVRDNDGRFRMLESVRLYAGERLEEHGEHAVTAERIIAWLCEKGEPGVSSSILTPEQVKAQHREYDNAAYAFARLVQPRDDRRLLLATMLLRVCFDRGCFARAGAVLMQVLHQSPADARYRILALEYASLLASHEERHEEAVKYATEAIETAESGGQDLIMCRLFRTLAGAHDGMGDVSNAAEALHRSIQYGVRNGNDVSVAVSSQNLGWRLLADGAVEAAAALVDGALPVLRAHARQDVVAIAVHTAGCIALERGDLVTAGARFAESVRMTADTPRAALEPVEGRGLVAIASGRHELGVRLLVACQQMRATWVVPPEAWWRRKTAAALDLARESLSRSAFQRALGAGRAMDARHALETALDSESVRHPLLSDRQRMVVELVARGLTNAQVAAKLGISHRTVESHVHNVKTTLDLSTRAQLTAWARSH